MRDSQGNVITVCSMENFDPVGVHTGDSIVVAPAVTLSDKEYQMLRTAALNIITALGVEGGCNCQFALNPDSFEYAVIEVNPRVSRSSALASKATGYPIAKVAAKIAIGYTLDEIRNAVTGKTCACFEPALDYVVVKFPKWPFDKFVYAKRTLGTQMKATGEVMAIGQSFEEAMMKAVRGRGDRPGQPALSPSWRRCPTKSCGSNSHVCDDERLFVVYEALRRGVPPEEIHADHQDRPLVPLQAAPSCRRWNRLLRDGPLTQELYRRAKRLGYPDTVHRPPAAARIELPGHCLPLSRWWIPARAEFDAQTPYFYCYATTTENEAAAFIAAHPSGRKTVIVFGSGPIRIGQGIEFDYASVHCVWALKEAGYDVVIVNNNPETVSTDFDTADRLYFEPLTEEDVA